MTKKQNKRGLSIQIRTIIGRPQYQYIAFILIADIIFVGSRQNTIQGGVNALIISGYIIWTLKSTLMQGFVKTIEYQLILPFLLIRFTQSLISSIDKVDNEK